MTHILVVANTYFGFRVCDVVEACEPLGSADEIKEQEQKLSALYVEVQSVLYPLG